MVLKGHAGKSMEKVSWTPALGFILVSGGGTVMRLADTRRLVATGGKRAPGTMARSLALRRRQGCLYQAGD